MKEGFAMNILFVTHYSDMYGANKSLLHLITDLQERYNIKPIVLMPEEGLFSKELEKRNIQFLIAKFYNWMVVPNKGIKIKGLIKHILNKKFIIQNKRIIKNLNIDIIHSNSSVCNIGIYLSESLKISHIWHIREFGKDDYNLEYSYSKKFIEKKYNSSTYVITISQAIQEHYKNIVRSNKLKMIYNGINIDTEYRRIFKNKSIIQFCIVGLVNESKNQIEVIQASKELINNGITNFCINIIGGGEEDYIKSLEKTIEKNNLWKFVKLWGYREDVDILLEKMDVGIIPSKKEAFGRVTIEYMAKYMPVIGANTGGTSELIKDDLNGFLYELEDYKDLADKMKYFILNINNIEKIGKQAFLYSIENFSMKKNTDKIYDVYKSLINKESML